MDGDLGKPIAYGRTAEIYAWRHGQVLKLFYAWFELENIENEARISRAIHASGLPSPAVGEIVQLNERYGLEYQRLEGESKWKKIQHKPWRTLRYGWRMAELQAEIHARNIQADLPSQRRKLESNIHRAEALPEPLKIKALAVLESLSDDDQLCHGDFWPGNILMITQGEMIIDWIHASRGNPLADLARTMNLAIGATTTRQIRRPFLSLSSTEPNSIKNSTKNSIFQFFCRICYPRYINYYSRLSPFNKNEYKMWLPIVAAARLSDNIPELEKMLLAQVEKGLT